MSGNRINGLLVGASLVAILAGCSSPREPFATRKIRPDEQCLTDAYVVENSMNNNPQAAFSEGKLMRYVVKKGDTLWDISKRFLSSPWHWKQLWYNNPQIRNPHLIYPGDVLSVVTINGEKRITITEEGPYHGQATGRYTNVQIKTNKEDHVDEKISIPVYKYKPDGSRTYSLYEEPIRILREDIIPMVTSAEILPPQAIAKLPTIFGNAGDYLSLTSEAEIYAQSLPQDVKEWKVYRTGEPIRTYKEGQASKNVLGFQMDYVGKVRVIGFDVVSGLTKLTPVEAVRPMQEGDVLMPINAQDDSDFFPHLPSTQCNRGYIIGNTSTETMNVKEFDTVLTSFGSDNGAQKGDIWKIVRPGPERIINGKPVQIPSKELGYLMIVRVYDKYSMGFILEASQNIDVTDWLVRP